MKIFQHRLKASSRRHTTHLHLPALFYLPSRTIIINISAFMCCLTNQIIPHSSAPPESIFSLNGWRQKEPVCWWQSYFPLTSGCGSAPSPAVSALATSWRPNIGVLTQQDEKASTKPQLIKAGKLQRPCLALIDLYQNTGIHVAQMLACRGQERRRGRR